jgi:hypothetical protein
MKRASPDSSIKPKDQPKKRGMRGSMAGGASESPPPSFVITIEDSSDDEKVVLPQQEPKGPPPPPPPAFAQVFERAPGAAELQRITAHFKANGFVIVRALDRAQCRAHIKRQVVEIFLKQPWAQKLVVRCPRTKAPLDIHLNTDAYLDELTRTGGIPPAILEHYKDTWPFHAGFGACCDPNAFHLPEMWEVRQDPHLYAIAVALTGTAQLWVDINRPIMKLPEQGEQEFLHWDLPYLHKTHEPDKAIGGKVMFTEGKFICVPGTATPEFQARFRAQYAAHYTHSNASDAKFALDPKKPDPLGLVAAKLAIHVPAGCAIFWSQWALHGVVKNPKRDGHIEFGMYLGYMPPVDRQEYRKKCGGLLGEREDRLRSFADGVAPKLWPSLDRIYYYPKRYLNIQRMLQPYIDKTARGYPGLTRREVKSKPGTFVDDILPLRDAHYAPPVLTELGERLLGSRPW